MDRVRCLVQRWCLQRPCICILIPGSHYRNPYLPATKNTLYCRCWFFYPSFLVPFSLVHPFNFGVVFFRRAVCCFLYRQQTYIVFADRACIFAVVRNLYFTYRHVFNLLLRACTILTFSSVQIQCSFDRTYSLLRGTTRRQPIQLHDHQKLPVQSRS